MTEKTLEVNKQEANLSEDVERTRSRRVFIPAASIYETEDQIIVLADMPGVDETSIDITLEKNELSIDGYVEPYQPKDFTQAYAEYQQGDYHRSFMLSNEVDKSKIEASVKDGVLKLVLPKSVDFKARKISVTAG